MKKIYTRPILQAMEVYNASLLTSSGDEEPGYGEQISPEDAPKVSGHGIWQ